MDDTENMTEDPAEEELHPVIEEPPRNNLDYYQIKVLGQANGTIRVDLRGIFGANPQVQNHSVALWPNSSPIPGTEPAQTYPIKSQSLPFTTILEYDHLSFFDYGLTYQVNGSTTTICALTVVYNSIEASSVLPVKVRLRLEKTTRTSVEVDFSLLSGYNPKTYGNWVGIWRDLANVSILPPALGFAEVTTEQSAGTVTIEGLDLRDGDVYSILYFMNPKDATAPAAGGALYFSLPEAS